MGVDDGHIFRSTGAHKLLHGRKPPHNSRTWQLGNNRMPIALGAKRNLEFDSVSDCTAANYQVPYLGDSVLDLEQVNSLGMNHFHASSCRCWRKSFRGKVEHHSLRANYDPLHLLEMEFQFCYSHFATQVDDEE